MTAVNGARYVGIMANESEGFPPFAERNFYSRLCIAGRSFGLTVFAFSPLRIDQTARAVKGYTFISEASGWEERWFPLPDLLYDRSFFVHKQEYTRHRIAVRQLHHLKPIPYLGHGLKSKWEMLAYLRRAPELRPYLPRTAKLLQPEQAAEWLDREERIFLKPQSGSHGKGAIMLERLNKGYRVRARDSLNRPMERAFRHKGDLTEWLRFFIGPKRYLIQQYLSLQSKEGETWDVRSLVQKNGRGVWVLTGTAVRRGSPGSITSNIHGGGAALETGPFLRQQFGTERAADIEDELRFLSERIPPVLEASNGRMAELGLDLGVDTDGRIWIIEVNTKPGRSIFRELCHKEAGYRAARNPMAYASHLLRLSAPVPGLHSDAAKG